MAAETVASRIRSWFASRDWSPFPFQKEVWNAVAAGESGLLHATTGAGKTYAVWYAALAALAEIAPPAAEPPVPDPDSPAPKRGKKKAEVHGPKLTVLWLTPMRALAADSARALVAPLEALGTNWTVGTRTGDTSSAERGRQAKRLPTALITTPESLTLMLTRSDAHETLRSVRMVVVDEWHELLGNKRGVQVQLALARLRRWNPQLVVWGLSATLGNLDEAREVLLGPGAPGRTVQGKLPKTLVVDTLIPKEMERFPWAGHLGIKSLPAVVKEIDSSESTLVFTNTRSQTELWYQALLEARPDWAGVLAIHHGSLDRDIREWVELALKEGRAKAVVCTSSLDLGVDFLPVERVLQIGSPKGVARLMQRAGRSGHAPGRPSRVTCVPSHALELVESAAARRAIAAKKIEPRIPPSKPLDVLVQHLITIALGGGFQPDELFAEVRGTHAYRELTQEEWRWALDFVVSGGSSLHAYPEYQRVVIAEDGTHRVEDKTIARRHRMSVGTIVADAAIEVRWMSGGRIGSVEESFIGRLNNGDCFIFAGRLLELTRINDMTAYVKKAQSGRPAVPVWGGGKMPLSSELSEAVRELLSLAREGKYPEPELKALAPLFDIQSRWSTIPGPGELLVEIIQTREGFHFFCFPFAGRSVHIGLASLLALRIGRKEPVSFSMSMNDYGFELLSPTPVAWRAALREGLFTTENLEADITASLNAGELAKRRFREIARVAGLVFQGYPGTQKSTRQIQASSGLFYDVFGKYEPDNLLYRQAQREVLTLELEIGRLRETLDRIGAGNIRVTSPPKPTPFAFPLMVERIREKLSTERVADRVARMLAALESEARGESQPKRSAPAAPRPTRQRELALRTTARPPSKR